MNTIPNHSMGVAYNGLHKTTSPNVQSINDDLASIKSNSFTVVKPYYPQYNGSIALMPLFQSANLNVLLSLFIFPDHLNTWVPANYNDYVKPYLSSANLLGVLIGNEDYGSNSNINDTINTYLEQVKKDNSNMPVSTAQTTDFWLNDNNAQDVAKLCDFIAVNIYPAWNWNSPDASNQPNITVDDGFDSFTSQYSSVKSAYTGKQIVVTEVGWPTTYGWVVNVPPPKQYQVGLDNANAFFSKVGAWAQSTTANVYYYSMFDDWYGVNTTSQFNFHFGRLDTNRNPKTPS